MDFEFVLADLLSKVKGAVGVVMVDEQGETVEVFGQDSPIYDIKILGAYQAIFLERVRERCRQLEMTDCRELAFRLGDELFLTHALPDGYFVTLIVGPETPEGIARRQLSLAARELGQILF